MWVIFDTSLSSVSLSLMKNLCNLAYLRLTKARPKAFVSVIRKALTLIWEMNTSDVKFSWRSFSGLTIDLKSLARIEMCISAKVVWATRFSSFLTLACSSLPFCSWLRFSSGTKRFSNHCRRLKEQGWNHRRHRCHIQCSLFDLKHLSFSCSCIAAW